MVRYSTKKSLFWEISGYWLLRGGIWWLFVVKKTLFTPYDYIILKQNCEVCNACNCIDMTVNYFQLKHQTRKMPSQWPSSQFSDTTWLLNHIIPWPVTSFFYHSEVILSQGCHVSDPDMIFMWVNPSVATQVGLSYELSWYLQLVEITPNQKNLASSISDSFKSVNSPEIK